jgi:hypothetical protein
LKGISARNWEPITEGNADDSGDLRWILDTALGTRLCGMSSLAVIEETGSARSMGRSVAAKIGTQFATVGVVAAAFLIYVSGSFLVAEVFGVKRYLQILLMLPIAVVASYYLLARPGRLFDPLICFVIVKTATEVALRGQWLYLLDDIATLLALIVLFAAPIRSIETGARLVVWLAGTLSVMALLQWTILFFAPQLAEYSLVVSDEGVIENTIKHPIALLGMFGDLQYSFLGNDVARLQSFAMEPSLNVVYFLLPASLAFLLNTRSSVTLGLIILTFCVLSFSGSVYLALAFSALWWLLLWFFTIKFALSYGALLALAAYLYVIENIGFGPLLEGIAYLAQFGDFLGKNASLTDRGISALANMEGALASPFGSTSLSDMAGPWLINATLEAGWLGALLLLAFLGKLGRQFELLNAHCSPLSMTRFASLLLLGAITTIVVFNDYQMSNYAGLVLLAFILRTTQVRNQADGHLRLPRFWFQSEVKQ